MKRKYLLIMLSLLGCLFIYLFYRTEKTVVNQVAIFILSQHRFEQLRLSVTAAVPLHPIIIYSLPEGLWVFCLAITSKSFFIRFGRHELLLSVLPLIIAIGLEFFQLLHVSNGRFDLWDIFFSFIFWLIGILVAGEIVHHRNIAGKVDLQRSVCVMSYLVMYLAHVYQ